MINLKLSKDVRELPARQQVALWVILKKFHKEKGTWFTVADFANEMKTYLDSKDLDSLGRVIGGILSSLVRNEMIEQFTGGRNPVWSVNSELHKHAKEYADSIYPVITYWENR